MVKPILQLINVGKAYQSDSNSIEVLKNINFQINQGDFIAIMGPSGSGKSTLMNIAGCLDTPTSGKVVFEGKNVSKLSESELAQIRNKKIGFVFQSFNLIPRTTALDNAQLPLVYAGFNQEKRNQITKEKLEKFGLGKRACHFPNQLSGGEQQRVAIVRALVNNPAIVLADEPTGNLDSKTGKEILKIFTQLNKQGNTIVLVTHDHDIAKKAKKIIKIYDGKIV